MEAFIAQSATISPDANIHPLVKVWDFVQIREGVRLGRDVVIGRGAYLGPSVRVGERCKIQNYAMIYDGSILENGVFIGPGVILTNDRLPRSVRSDGVLKGPEDWSVVSVAIREGASIGAGAVCVAPVQVGAWAMVAAGSVVVRDVPDHALVAGNPARQIGWVGRDGQRMVADGGVLVDESTGARFVESEGRLVEQS